MKRKISIAVVLIAIVAMTAMMFTSCGKSKDEDWSYIESKGELIVGLDDTFAPMGFHDENDELVGLDIDLAKAVGEKLGIKITFKSIDWNAKEAELKAKNIDPEGPIRFDVIGMTDNDIIHIKNAFDFTFS